VSKENLSLFGDDAYEKVGEFGSVLLVQHFEVLTDDFTVLAIN